MEAPLILEPEVARDVQLLTTTKKGSTIRSAARIVLTENDRIEFLKSPFSLKDEIRAMKGSKWHGHLEDDGRKIWSVENCHRNRTQLAYLMGEDVYAWFDQEIVKHDYTRPLMEHQRSLADAILTLHYQIIAGEPGIGKTLTAQEVIERSGLTDWVWAGPKTSLPNMEREFRKWGFPFHKISVKFVTYDALKNMEFETVPQGLICDEATRVKTPGAQRTVAVQKIADMIRDTYKHDGYVVLMSGTPAPKSPLDWWSLAEITWPGFLKEGSVKSLEQRLAFLVKGDYDAGTFNKRIGWKDDESKCDVCGDCEELHEFDATASTYHKFVPSKNEVAYLGERLKGLVQVRRKKDCLDLPEKVYRKIICPPTPSLLRAAKALTSAAPNAMTAMTWLRELSDGFQYREAQEGTMKCDHCEDGKVFEWFHPEGWTFSDVDMMDPAYVALLDKRQVECPNCNGTQEVPRVVRISRDIPCPKDKAYRSLLGECEESGRIVTFAGFTGSIDRIVKICHSEDWNVVRCDAGNFQTLPCPNGVKDFNGHSLDYWAELDIPRVAFVANPESGGQSLTLTQSHMAVFFSNTWKPEFRFQAEDRIHRIGADFNRGCQIVDIIHLPTDNRVLNVLKENRKLELMSMGEVFDEAAWAEVQGELAV